MLQEYAYRGRCSEAMCAYCQFMLITIISNDQIQQVWSLCLENSFAWRFWEIGWFFVESKTYLKLDHVVVLAYIPRTFITTSQPQKENATGSEWNSSNAETKIP